MFERVRDSLESILVCEDTVPEGDALDLDGASLSSHKCPLEETSAVSHLVFFAVVM